MKECLKDLLNDKKQQQKKTSQKLKTRFKISNSRLNYET